MTYKRLSSFELGELFGVKEGSLCKVVGEQIAYAPLSYRELTLQERDQTLLEILKLLDSSELRVSGPHRHSDWEYGWRENLIEFKKSGYNPLALLPKYYGKNRPCRMNNTVVQGESKMFLYSVSDIFRRWVFKTYFSECRSVHEFGCGTGHNLIVVGELFPNKALVGYDWALASQRLLVMVKEKLGINVEGRRFDFFDSQQTFELGPEAGVLTFGALEQVHHKHGPFLERLLKAKPAICVHVEGFIEMYDQNNLLDYMAYRYHKARNYLDGYLSALWELETKGSIEIHKVHRQHFGNLYDDPYSLVVWSPK